MMTENQRSWRRWLRPRFSLSNLLLVMAVICVGAWGLKHYYRHRELAAIDSLESRGWGIRQYHNGEVDLNGAGRPHLSFRDIDDINAISKVARLDLCKEVGTCYLLNCLNGSPSLRVMNLSGSDVTSEDLACLGKFPELEQLTLTAPVGSDALTHLPYRRLRYLELFEVRLEKRPFDFSALEHLEVLILHGGDIRDSALRSLGGCGRLRWLTLDNSSISGEGFSPTDTYRLDTLTLHGCPLSDKGLRSILQSPSRNTLRRLDISPSPSDPFGPRPIRCQTSTVIEILQWPCLEQLKFQNLVIVESEEALPPTPIRRVATLDISNGQFTPESLDGLLGPGVQHLNATDADGLSISRHLGDCLDLEALELGSIRIVETDLRVLERLSKLKSVSCTVMKSLLEPLREFSRNRPTLALQLEVDPTEETASDPTEYANTFLVTLRAGEFWPRLAAYGLNVSN